MGTPPEYSAAFAGSGPVPDFWGADAGQVNGEVCVTNIGPRERRRRLLFGVVVLSAGAVAGGALVASGLPAWWRLLLFAPFVAGASGVFQWREKTWVNLAGRGARNMDTGIEEIGDDTVLRQVRRQARKVNIESALVAAGLTLLFLLIPR